MDAVVAAMVGGALTLAGVLLADVLGRRRDDRGQRRADDAAAAARVRERVLLELEETRTVLAGQLSFLEEFIALRATTAPPDMDRLTHYNINLVGDVDAIRNYGDLVTDLLGQVPVTTGQAMRYLLGRALAPMALDPELMARCARVRSQLLSALDAQERRALRGEPLLELTAEEKASIPGPEAIVAMLRTRLARK